MVSGRYRVVADADLVRPVWEVGDAAVYAALEDSSLNVKLIRHKY